MIPFNVDLSDTAAEFNLQKAEIDSLCGFTLDRVVDEYMSKWMSLIDQSLHGTRDEYKRAMYTERSDDHTAVVGLISRASKIPIMIELGADAFDEKIGFEGSEKKTFKDNGKGWYLTIPFRHAVSEAIMEMEVPEMGVSVIELMKSGATIGREQLPEGFSEIQTHQLTLKTGTLITYKHKAPVYEGLHRRDIRSTMNEKRGGYFTFRRVSDKSDPQSWIHPGFAPHLFMNKALNLIQTGQAVDNAVQDWLDAKFG